MPSLLNRSVFYPSQGSWTNLIGLAIGWASAVCLLIQTTRATELIQLTASNYQNLVPRGKEVDAIYGDWLLRNEHILAVVAAPRPGRNANMTVRGVGGMLIDFTSRASQSDQLGCFYPAAGRYSFADPSKISVEIDGQVKSIENQERFEGREIKITIKGTAISNAPSSAEVTYTLRDRQRYLDYQVSVVNSSSDPQSLVRQDSIRCDGPTFQFAVDESTRLFTAEEPFYRQCYGILPTDGTIIKPTDKRTLNWKVDEKSSAAVAPGGTVSWSGKLLASQAIAGVRELADSMQKLDSIQNYQLKLQASDGVVDQAEVEIFKEGQSRGLGFTNQEGLLRLPLAPGKYALKIKAHGRDMREHSFEISNVPLSETLTLSEASRVKLSITDSQGKPIAAKIEFRGTDGTSNPNFGPDSSDFGVRNLVYTARGEGVRTLAPGKYNVVISHGPEYDAIEQAIEVLPGKQVTLSAKLPRVVDSKGWVSAEFHSHSSPSGDNTSSQLGRVLNLLAEHLEFAPCTEHNRIDTYDDELKQLGASSAMATCTGMELTGSPLPLNHQNAFPLRWKPNTQDGGGPVTDPNPVVQIERLSLWDSGSKKVVQSNHPNIPQMLGDRDLDGKPDEGFRGMLGFMDVIEVHPPEGIFNPPSSTQAPKERSSNPIFHWVQLLNLGYRITGVVNTDAHYNWHGSGWLRNYIASSTDEPDKISLDEMIQASEQGNLVMTNAPFLEAQVRVASPGTVQRFISGNEVPLRDAKAKLWIRVQCANWYDINRVQVFANGRPIPELNFTRKTHPDLFSGKTVRFEHELELPKFAVDTHIIVATIGEGLTLGNVMGAEAGSKPPVAVTNPIYLDVNGGGFEPNRDDLDVPVMLPGKANQ